MSEVEFEQLQAEMKEISVVNPQDPEEPQFYAAKSPYIEDHSMEFYVEKVRDLLGITTPH